MAKATTSAKQPPAARVGEPAASGPGPGARSGARSGAGAAVSPPSPDHNSTGLDTHQKALAINLDATSFGSFAEIGAGQEVARWFLRVGAASGSVAKTISAYDKEVSDDLYGAGTRYVSKQRLEAMLECEWKSLLQQVADARGKTTRFFAFANTIAARNFAGSNDCHGWIGVRFQHRPGSQPSDILLHVNLRDNSNVAQQEAVGVLGVNLLHALLNERAAMADVPARLFEGLAVERLEIDEINATGAAFGDVDARALHLALARDGRAEAVTLTGDGEALAANEFLYKKAVIIVPAPLDEHESLAPAAIAEAIASLQREIAMAGDQDVKSVMDVRLLFVDPDTPATTKTMGATLATRHHPLYRATAFLRRYTQAPLRFALSLPALIRIFDEARYQQLDGRMLEGIARLFANDVRVLAHPAARDDMRHRLAAEASRGWSVADGGRWLTADQLRPQAPLRHLYEYLLATGFLVPMPPPATA